MLWVYAKILASTNNICFIGEWIKNIFASLINSDLPKRKKGGHDSPCLLPKCKPVQTVLSLPLQHTIPRGESSGNNGKLLSLSLFLLLLSDPIRKHQEYFIQYNVDARVNKP